MSNSIPKLKLELQRKGGDLAGRIMRGINMAFAERGLPMSAEHRAGLQQIALAFR
jgi:hypothetical protein